MPWPKYLLDYRFSGSLCIFAADMPSTILSTGSVATFVFRFLITKYCSCLSLLVFLQNVWRQVDKSKRGFVLMLSVFCIRAHKPAPTDGLCTLDWIHTNVRACYEHQQRTRQNHFARNGSGQDYLCVCVCVCIKGPYTLSFLGLFVNLQTLSLNSSS